MRVLVAIVALFALGCALSDAASAAGWERRDIRAVTQPVVVRDRLVLYAEVDRQLRLLALSARTGRTLWSQPASPSQVTPGVAPEIVVIDRTAYFLGAGEGRTAHLTAIDVATGRFRWRTDPGVFS